MAAPSQSDLDDIQDWADNNGVDAGAAHLIHDGSLVGTDGWRDRTFPNIGQAFDYVEDGGFHPYAVFLWDDVQNLWRVYVAY